MQLFIGKEVLEASVVSFDEAFTVFLIYDGQLVLVFKTSPMVLLEYQGNKLEKTEDTSDLSENSRKLVWIPLIDVDFVLGDHLGY